jgi:hypothetical protein
MKEGETDRQSESQREVYSREITREKRERDKAEGEWPKLKREIESSHS